MDVRVGLWRKLSAKELMLLNCCAGENSWKSLGLQGDPTSPFWRRSALDFFGRNDAKAETLVLWPPYVKSWLIGKDPDAGRDWGQEEKGTIEDEMAGWHHWLDGHKFEWTPGAGDGQGGLVCCDSWGRKESDMTEWLNWTELNWIPNKSNLVIWRLFKYGKCKVILFHLKVRITNHVMESWYEQYQVNGKFLMEKSLACLCVCVLNYFIHFLKFIYFSWRLITLQYLLVFAI